MKRMVLLALLLACTIFATNPAPPAASSSFDVSPHLGTGYWCPPYSRYCSRASQCAGYCGTGVPPEWEVCSNGCCACLG